MEKIKLNIDGAVVEVEKGSTVLEAARTAGIEIPTICAHQDLEPYGACRMCIVEIEGVRGYPTSCTTPAQDGMKVKTSTPEIEELRASILELMLSGHPNACLACPHREACETYRPRPTKAGRTTRCGFCSNRDSCMLRDLTFKMEPESRLQLPTLYADYNVEKFDPFMDRDFNLCILCGRCWRICEKVHGKPYIMIVSRGRWAHPGTSFNKGHLYSGCTFCGACVDICPTGALSDRYARWYGGPEHEVPSTCTVCPEGCTAWIWRVQDKVIATRMKDFSNESRMCAIGRFAYAQMANAPDRMRRPLIRHQKGQDQVPAGYDEAIKAAAQKLSGYPKERLAVIANQCDLRENKYMYEFLAGRLGCRIGCVPASGDLSDMHPKALKQDLDAGEIKAALVAGSFLCKETLAGLASLVVIDWLQSGSSEAADVFFPAAVLSELEGTFCDKEGEIKQLDAVTKPPGEARPDWAILRDLAKAMGAPGMDFGSVSEVTPKIKDDQTPSPLPGSPRDDLADVPSVFRGHYIADVVCALESMGLPVSPPGPVPGAAEGGYMVKHAEEIVPNFHLVRVVAPQVAEFAKPGQFVIMMVHEGSERVPYTLADWDPDTGEVTVIVEEVGRSSQEVAALKEGDRVAHVVGPLGMPFQPEKVGTVALGGGCYGIGAIYPLARALKQAGNKVVSVIEASSQYLLYWEDKLEQVSDELIIATKDGSKGVHGGVQEVFADLVERGEEIEYFVAVGCTFMMRMVSEATRKSQIPTYVALNPIMVDGTGMCGACRVTVEGDTKFACVDGPMFNGHDVDWDELFSRRGAYARVEVEAMPQGTQLEKAAQKLRAGKR